MGLIGILFEVENEQIQIKIPQIQNCDEFIILFENERVNRNLILGFKNIYSIPTHIPIYIINTKFILNKMIITDKMGYVLIRNSNKEIIDLENMIFWVKPLKYIKLREKIQIKTDLTIEKLVEHTSEIIDLIQTKKRF